MPYKRPQKFEQQVPVSGKSEKTYDIVAEWLRAKAVIIGSLDVIPEFGDEKYLALGVGSGSKINGKIFPVEDDTWATVDMF